MSGIYSLVESQADDEEDWTLQEYFRLNGHDVGFGSHSIKGTVYVVPTALTTEVLVRRGKLRINLLTPEITLSRKLHNGLLGDDEPHLKHGIRFCTYYDIATQYGTTITTLRDKPFRQQNINIFNVYGIDSTSTFEGEIRILQGVVEVQGHIVFNAFYDKDGNGVQLPIEIRKTFAPEPLFPPRKALTLEQARNQDPLNVYELAFKRGSFDTFPEEVLQYKNLESFTIFAGTPCSFTRLPEAIGDLKNLHTFNLYGGAQLKELPESFAKLSQLSILHLPCEFETVPQALKSLVNLEELSLQANQLKTIPEWLPELPKLQTLNLKYNPFESLPKNLVKVARVDIEGKYLPLYQDWTYSSSNLESIDSSLYNFESKPQLLNILETEIEKISELKKHKSKITEASQWCISAAAYKYQHLPVGISKFGGAPDLPKGMAYPKTDDDKLYIFHAQINLKDIAHLQDYLPKQGMLSFFVRDEEYATQPKIFFFSEETDWVPFVYGEDDEYQDVGHQRRESYALRFYLDLSLPDFYKLFDFDTYLDLEDARQKLAQSISKHINIPVESDFDDLKQTQNFTSKSRVFFANALTIGGFPFTQNETPNENAAATFKGKPEEWFNLLTIDSFDVPKVCIWDAGTLTYSVHKKDLAILDFKTIATMIESG